MVEATASQTTASTSAMPSLEETNALVDQLIEKVRRKGPGGGGGDLQAAASVRSSLLRLKSAHRGLCRRVTALQSRLVDVRRERDAVDASVRALESEGGSLEASIGRAGSYRTPRLALLSEQMAAAAEPTTTDGEQCDETATPSNNRQLFDIGRAESDPSQREEVIRRLHEEMRVRAALEKELERKEAALEEKSTALAGRRKFLSSLPDHLASIERASLPLQRHVHAHIPATKAVTGTDRHERMKLAYSHLPPALYTLFRQVQHWIDSTTVRDSADSSHAAAGGGAASSNPQISKAVTISVVGGSGNTGASRSVSAIATPPSHHGQQQRYHVVVTFPVPDVLHPEQRSVSKKRLSVVFRSQELIPVEDGDGSDQERQQQDSQLSSVITVSLANTAGGGIALTSVYPETLLEELFPGDKGFSAADIVGDDDEAGSKNKSSNGALSYSWANYLGGLQLSTAAVDCDQPHRQTLHQPPLSRSTRVVMRELRRRIRSNATLKYILQTSLVQQRRIPSPPAIASAGDDENDNVLSSCQVQSCAAVPQKDEPARDSTARATVVAEQTYAITLRNTANAATWTVRVRVNLARYPATPPSWFLVDEESNLYDAKLAGLQQHVNEGLLLQRLGDAEGPAGDGRDDQDEGADIRADWILVLQLRAVVRHFLRGDQDDDEDDDDEDMEDAASSRKRKRR